MRILCGMFILLLCSALRTEASAKGQIINTSTCQGVIFTPQMILRSSAPWEDPDEDAKKATLWTPPAALVAKAESELSSRLEKVQTIIPSEGFHFREYYTPKYSSRDRNPPPSPYVYTGECFQLELWMDELKSSRQRQYIGVTANGEKALLMNFLNAPVGTTWKNTWRCQGRYFYYLIEKDEFTYALFPGEMENW